MTLNEQCAGIFADIVHFPLILFPFFFPYDRISFLEICVSTRALIIASGDTFGVAPQMSVFRISEYF